MSFLRRYRPLILVAVFCGVWAIAFLANDTEFAPRVGYFSGSQAGDVTTLSTIFAGAATALVAWLIGLRERSAARRHERERLARESLLAARRDARRVQLMGDQARDPRLLEDVRRGNQLPK